MTMTSAAFLSGFSNEMGRYFAGTTTAAGTASNATMIDTALAEYPTSDQRLLKSWVLIQSGNNDGKEREISAYAASSTLTTSVAFTAQVAASVTYQIHKWKPSRIIEKANNAIKRTKHLYQVIDNTSVATRTAQYSYPVPSSIIGDPRQIWVSKDAFSNVLIHDCETAWDELVDADATVALDALDYQVGQYSNKFAIAAGMAAGDIIATDNISAKDLSKCIGVEFDIKSSVAAAAGDLQLLLDESASCASPSETLNVPALTANVWQHVMVIFAGATTDRNAIISVGLKYTVDIGACNVWIDNIEAISTVPADTMANMERWTMLWNWRYDAAASKVHFDYSLPAARKLRFIGPGYLTALTTSLANSALTGNSIETGEPEVRHLYALTAYLIYENDHSDAVASGKAEVAQERDKWAAYAELWGRDIKLNLPLPTRKKSGWTYYGRTAGW